MSARLLCAADLHLGRRAARLPDDLDAVALGPRQAWRRFVGAALGLGVDAVVLTGDVVDESNRFFEAFSVLQAGVAELAAGGIPVYAVSGNHDFEVLPRLADTIEDFHLLGRAGQWEEAVLSQSGAPCVRFCGWSFPSRHVSTNPLAGLALSPSTIPTVGLLHCDCDVTSSTYAPVSLTELKAMPLDAWLLGHIHKPGLLSREAPLVLYPGSPQGLDPTEQGRHGAALVTIGPPEPTRAEWLPLGALRWEEVVASLDGVEEEPSLGPAIVDALRAAHESLREELGHTRVVGCRIRLSGRTPIHRGLPSVIPTVKDELRPTFDDVEYFVDDILDSSRPDFDLQELSRSPDPAGLLAKRLLVLDGQVPADEYSDLIRRARAPLEEERANPAFALLPDSTDTVPDEEIRGTLLEAGLIALDELLAQKETRP